MAAEVLITSSPADGGATLSTSLPDLGGALALSDTAAVLLDGAASAGVSKLASRSDHKHSVQAATSSLAGTMSAADKAKLDAFGRSVLQDSADPTGAADSLAAIQATSAAASEIFYPAGTYKIGSTGTLGAAGKTHRFARGSVLHVLTGATLTIRGAIDAADDQQIVQVDSGGSLVLSDVTRVSVRWTGAVPDNSTDCGPSIQTAAAAISRGTVYVPGAAQAYKVASAIAISSKSGVFIEGDGYTSELAGTLSAAVLTLTSCTNSKVRRLKVSGSHHGGVYVSGGSAVQVYDCDLSGNTADASGGIVFDGVSNCAARRNALHGNSYGDIVAPAVSLVTGTTANSTHLKIEGNGCSSTEVLVNIHLYNTSWANIRGNECSGAVAATPTPDSGGYGIMIYLFAADGTHPAGTNNGNNCIANNTIHDTQGAGVYLQSQGSSNVVAGNVIYNVASVETDGSLMVGGVAANNGNCTITGNTIETSGRSGIAVSGAAFDPTIAGGVTITGNRIRNCGSFGIWAYRVNDIAITGNAIDTTTKDGIRLQGIVRGTVVGNSCKASSFSGIFGASDGGQTLTDVVISHNTVNGATQEGIYINCAMANGAITGNTITNVGLHGLAVFPATGATTGVDISGNSIVDASQTTDVTYHAVYLRGTTNCRVRDNTVSKTGTNKVGYGLFDDANTNAVFDNNAVDPAACGSDVFDSFGGSTNTQGSDRGAAAPTVGTFPVGWRRYNTAPAASGTVGWVNTATGWKTFGSIAA